MTSTKRRLAASVMAASLLSLAGCDSEPAETVDPDPQGPAEQAPGTKGPQATPT